MKQPKRASDIGCMKKILLTLSACLGCMLSMSAYTPENIKKYQLEDFKTVEDFRDAYLNKVLTYSPVETKFLASSTLSQQMRLGLKMIDFVVTGIEGKTKKNAKSQTMTWTIESVDGGETRTFIVHSGIYNKEISRYSRDSEFVLDNLQLFDFSSWKEEHQKEVGTVFRNPLVKAYYTVVDVFLDIKMDPSDYKDKPLKMYLVKNSDTGETLECIAENAQIECFKEDLSGQYVSSLSKVEKPANAAIKYGETTTVEEDGITKYTYEDNYISILIFGGSQQFRFNLKNVSDYSIKLVWDDAVFVSTSGLSSKIMHGGIRYSQRDAPQPASTIIRGAALDYIACPIDNVYYDTLLEEWRIRSMFPSDVQFETKHISLMLPLLIQDVVNEYIFVFDVNYVYKHPERLTL